MSASVELTFHSNQVGILTLNRPDKRNAFNDNMIQEMISALNQCHDFKDLRVLEIRAAGNVFCAGADLHYMKKQAQFSYEDNVKDAQLLSKMFYLLASIPVPTRAHIHGAAIGGGLGLISCIDYVSAHSNTMFATSEVRLGLVPGVISPYVIRKVGCAHASDFMLTGRRFSAQEAHTFGLINSINDTDHNQSPEWDEWTSIAPEASKVTKQLIRNMHPLPDPKLIQSCIEAIARARCSAEGQEGINAFFEKRLATWSKK